MQIPCRIIKMAGPLNEYPKSPSLVEWSDAPFRHRRLPDDDGASRPHLGHHRVVREAGRPERRRAAIHTSNVRDIHPVVDPMATEMRLPPSYISLPPSPIEVPDVASLKAYSELSEVSGHGLWKQSTEPPCPASGRMSF